MHVYTVLLNIVFSDALNNFPPTRHINKDFTRWKLGFEDHVFVEKPGFLKGVRKQAQMCFWAGENTKGCFKCPNTSGGGKEGEGGGRIGHKYRGHRHNI